MKPFLFGLLFTVISLTSVGPAAAQGNFNPRAGSSATVAAGGTAVTALPAKVSGCYITNPLSATDQGIMTAEDIYVDPTGIAATTTGNGTNVAIQPGRTWFCIPYSNATVSANAVTSGHKFVVVRW